MPPILRFAGAAGSSAFILRLNASVSTPNSLPFALLSAAIPRVLRAPCSLLGSYDERSLNIFFRSERLRFANGGRGGGGPLGFAVARELGLTLVVRLWLLVAPLELKAEGLIVRRGERD